VVRVLAAVAVLLLHGWLVDGLWRLDGPAARDTRPPRLQALYVSLLTPQAAPAAAPVPLPAPATIRPRTPWIALPDLPPLDEPAPPPPDAAASAPDGPPAPLAAVPAGPAVSDAPPAQPPDDAFDWPPSTRLRYALTGHWRGPLEGRAQVEWLRDGDRYQVHLDIVIGLPVAPLIARQMSSDGRLGPGGLVPRRYDERTRVLWRDPVMSTITFGAGRIGLPGGRARAAPPGVQDAVSQFVQLAWRFTRDPSLLTPGGVVAVPLALPRSVGDWVYDVREADTLATPAGPVEAVRLAPRRRARTGGDLVPEMWFAPSLQYLPVRILVRGDGDSFVDLTIDRLPEQAAPAAGTAQAAQVAPPPAPGGPRP
jgi:hypothetical protein